LEVINASMGSNYRVINASIGRFLRENQREYGYINL
jgi:hypothetical protein